MCAASQCQQDFVKFYAAITLCVFDNQGADAVINRKMFGFMSSQHGHAFTAKGVRNEGGDVRILARE